MQKDCSTFALRLGLGIVFLIFGIGKLRQDIWFATMKSMHMFSMFGSQINYFIYFVGIVEIVIGISLVMGLFTRFFALLAALELVSILILASFWKIRDIALLAAAISLIITGSKTLCITPRK